MSIIKPNNYEIHRACAAYTKYFYIKRPQCMSPRRNWDSPTPSLASEYAPPPEQKGGGHTRLRVWGWGSPNSDDHGEKA
jgi:hypothetical protein